MNKNNKYHVSDKTNREIVDHVKKWGRFVDADTIHDALAGIAFLHDWGLISLSQWADLRTLYIVRAEEDDA